jgi:hypothetical protein
VELGGERKGKGKGRKKSKIPPFFSNIPEFDFSRNKPAQGKGRVGRRRVGKDEGMERRGDRGRGGES